MQDFVQGCNQAIKPLMRGCRNRENTGCKLRACFLQKAVKSLPVGINVDLVCRYQKLFILKPLPEILYLLLQHGKSLLRRHVGKLGNIKHIQQQPRALNMLEKLQPQALALRGPLNDARYVGHHKRAEVGQLNHTHHRIERGERIVGNFGMGL